MSTPASDWENREIRLNEVVLWGRIAEGPSAVGAECHFLLKIDEAQPPVHCFVRDPEIARNSLHYLHTGDEVGVEGHLQIYQFADGAPRWLILGDFLTYGRKGEAGLSPALQRS